ncbi:MAG: hypothetical protein HGA45_44445, partial [Chloroflexales bacterium]|nr:hypothetical protein [Chloroflexales bacterium]
RALEGGGVGELFVAISRDKEINPALAGEPPSCLEGLIMANDRSRLRHFRVELTRGAEVRRADHDHLTGTYAICGLDPGDWEVSIAEYLGVPASAAERAGHAVRFHTSGTPGEIFYISFQAQAPLPTPAAPLFPPLVPSPRPAESYDGHWEGTLTGMSPFGPASGRLLFDVVEGRVVYTESSGAPCAWTDPDLRATIADGLSFAGLAVRTGVYYELAAVFASPDQASGTLMADVGPGQPCLSGVTWTARKTLP